jgi:hypothetical protein
MQICSCMSTGSMYIRKGFIHVFSFPSFDSWGVRLIWSVTKIDGTMTTTAKFIYWGKKQDCHENEWYHHPHIVYQDEKQNFILQRTRTKRWFVNSNIQIWSFTCNIRWDSLDRWINVNLANIAPYADRRGTKRMHEEDTWDCLPCTLCQ